MTEFLTFQPAAARRGEKRFKAFPLGTGVSPLSGTIQLPKYGAFDWLAVAGYTNPQNLIVATGRSIYFRNDVVAASNPVEGSATPNYVCKTLAMGTPAIAAGPGSPANDLSGITVSDPDSTGLITVTATWATAATSRSPWVNFTFRQIFDHMDIRRLAS